MPNPSSRIQIVGVMSSARLDGNTALLVRAALRGAEEAGASITEIVLPKYRLGFCQGCLRCMAEGGCPAQLDHQEGMMKGVYGNLKQRGLL